MPIFASRRGFMVSLPFVLTARTAFASCLIPEGFLSRKYIAPQDAPPKITIIDDSIEPGERMVVTGLVTDGKKPLAKVSVYVFQPDSDGRYSWGGNDEENARLHGAMRTDPQGQFRYETIRPHGYKPAYGPAYVGHLTYIVRANGYRARMEEVRFEDSPGAFGGLEDSSFKTTKTPFGYVSNECSGMVFQVRPITQDAHGVWQVTHEIALQRE